MQGAAQDKALGCVGDTQGPRVRGPPSPEVGSATAVGRPTNSRWGIANRCRLTASDREGARYSEGCHGPGCDRRRAEPPGGGRSGAWRGLAPPPNSRAPPSAEAATRQRCPAGQAQFIPRTTLHYWSTYSPPSPQYNTGTIRTFGIGVCCPVDNRQRPSTAAVESLPCRLSHAVDTVVPEGHQLVASPILPLCHVTFSDVRNGVHSSGLYNAVC